MTSDGPHADRIRRLLALARSALRAGQGATALEMLETVAQLDAHNDEARLLRREAQAAVDADGGDGEVVDSMAWNIQYAAGADESIDEPPPLAMDLFDFEAPSIDDSFISGSEDSLGTQSNSNVLGTSDSLNPSQDPFTMPQDAFSDTTRKPSTGSPGVESANSKAITLKTVPHVTREALMADEASLLEPPSSPMAQDALDVQSTLSDKDSFKALTSLSSPVCLIDTLDEEVDDDLAEGVEDWLQLAVRRHDAGDFVASLELVERILEEVPHHAVAQRLRDENESRILQAGIARLGSMSHCPRVRLRQQEVVWQSLNHHEGFIISLVDGNTSYDTIVEISGMGEQQTLMILSRLVELGVIG